MANPTPAQLEARLKYFVPRLNASVARLEKHAAALAAATVRPLPKKRWFAALLRARDALEYHANGDLRGLVVDASRFPYARKRLVVARYYKEGKRYSGEAEDDANEAQRRLDEVDSERGERFALQLDAIEQRKTSCADAMKRSMKEALEILGRDSALELEYPREELRHGSTKLKRGDDLTGPEEFSQPPVKRGNSSTAPVKRGRLRRNVAASDSSDEEEGIDAVKRRTGHDPQQLAKGSEEMFAEHTEGEVVPEESKEEVDLAALEENEDWEALAKAARKQLSDDPINCGRALGRALSSLNRDEEALAAFSSAFEAARDYPDDIERVHVDRGRHWLDRAIAEDDELKQKHLANEALGDFERAATLGALHMNEGGEWPDAFARARYNAGLAFELAGNKEDAACSFETAAQGFLRLLEEERPDADLLKEMRGRALVYAGLCRMEKHANVAAVLYERAVLCLNEVAAKCPGVLLDALRGVVFARRQSGDTEGAKAASRNYAAAGGDLDDIDEESDDSVVDLTEFEVKAESLEGVDDDDLYNEMSQEEPLECLSGGFALKGPLQYDEREPEAPGDAIRRRFVHLAIPTGVSVVRGGGRPAKRRRGPPGAGGGRGGGGGPGRGAGGGRGGAGGPVQKRARAAGDNYGFAQRRPSAAPTKGRRRPKGAVPARRRPAAPAPRTGRGPTNTGAGRGPPVPAARAAPRTDADDEAEFEFRESPPPAPPPPPAAPSSSSDDESSSDDKPLEELRPRAAPRRAPRAASPRGVDINVDTLAARLGLLSHQERTENGTLTLGGADARAVATAARRCTSTALALRFCRGGAALAAAAAKASRLTSLSLMGCGLALDELAPLEGRLPHLTRVDLSANLLGRRSPSTQARSAGARALEDLAFRCDAVDMAQVCVEPQSRAYPFDGGDAVAGALARGLRKRNAPPSKIMLADNAFTAGAWREVLSALALRPPSDTLDVSRPGVLGSASEATWARDLSGAVRSASTIILDDADALALHAGRPAARGPIAMLSVTGRTAATELATVLASFAVEAEIERVAPHAILTGLERSDVLKHLSARGCRLDARRVAALLCAPALESLDAAGNDAAADATIDLGACLRNPRLRRVDLSGNGFDDGQRARLAAAFGCAPGRVLLLS